MKEEEGRKEKIEGRKRRREVERNTTKDKTGHTQSSHITWLWKEFLIKR